MPEGEPRAAALAPALSEALAALPAERRDAIVGTLAWIEEGARPWVEENPDALWLFVHPDAGAVTLTLRFDGHSGAQAMAQAVGALLESDREAAVDMEVNSAAPGGPPAG